MAAETKRGVLIRVSTEGVETVKANLRALGKDGQDTLQKLERSLNIKMPQAAEIDSAKRAADIAAYAQELDRLRAKYNPLFALQQQYKADLAEINQAARVGAISEQERAAAIDRTKAAFAGQVVAMNAASAASRTAAGAAQLNTFAMQNMAFQINDIGVMLASGQSPFVLLMQQGMQIAQLFGPGVGVRGALAATGGAIAAFVTNPLNLAVLGIASAAGAVSLLWNSVSGSESQDAADALSRHKEIIDQIAGSYGDATAGAKRYVSESLAVLEFLRKQSAIDIEEIIKTAAEGAQGSELPLIFGRGTGAAGVSAITQVRMQTDPIMRAVDELRRGVQAGKPDILAFREALANIGNAPEADADMRARIAVLLELTDKAAEGARELSRVRQNLTAWTPGRRASFDTGFGESADATASLTRDLEDLPSQRAAKRAAEEALRLAEARERELQRLSERYSANQRYLELVNDLAEAERRGYLSKEEYDTALAKAQRERVKNLEEERRAVLELQNTWGAGVQLGFAEYADMAGESAKNVADLTKKAFQGAEDALVQFATTGKASFKDLANSIIQDLIRIAIRAAITRAVSSLFGATPAPAAGPMPGTPWSFGAFDVSSGRAGGGPVMPGRLYPIGERGVELFAPGMPGNIIPNHALGGGGGHVDNRVYNIDARGAQQGVGEEIRAALEAYDREAMPKRAVQAVSDHVTAGGTLGRGKRG